MGDALIGTFSAFSAPSRFSASEGTFQDSAPRIEIASSRLQQLGNGCALSNYNFQKRARFTWCPASVVVCRCYVLTSSLPTFPPVTLVVADPAVWVRLGVSLAAGSTYGVADGIADGVADGITARVKRRRHHRRSRRQHHPRGRRQPHLDVDSSDAFDANLRTPFCNFKAKVQDKVGSRRSVVSYLLR